MRKSYFFLWVFLLFYGISGVGYGQPWTYNFGTGTGSHTSSTASTTFLPTPSSGTARVRVGTNPGSITLANPGLAGLGTDSELQITSNTGSSSTTKFSVYDYTAAKVGYVKFKVSIAGGTNGVYNFTIGDGANFSDNNAIGTTQIFAGIRWSLGASNAVTYNVLDNATWVTTGISNSNTLFTQSTSTIYTVEVYFNNTTSVRDYYRSGSNHSLTNAKWDLWVDGTRVGTGLAKGGLGTDVNIDSYSFNHQVSASSPGTIYLDDIEYSNSLIAPEPTTQASNVSFSSVGTTSMTINWTSGNGSNRIVVLKSGSAVDFSPTDGTAPSGVNADFSAATDQGSGNKIVYNGSGTSVAVTGLSAGTTYHVAVYEYNGSGTAVNYLTTSPLTGNQTTTGAGTPAITTSTTSISSFGNVITGSNSGEGNFTVSGSSLSTDLVVTAPTGFQVSTTSGSGFGNSVSLTPLGGTVATTTIYVRFSPGTASGAFSGNITNTSTGAEQKNVAVTGNALDTEPTTQSAITFGAVTANSLVVNFSGGNGEKRIIVARQGNAVSFVPTDAAVVTGVNADFATATDQGSGNKIVYDGTGSTVTVTGLTEGTVYHFASYEYNEGTGTSQNYFIVSPGANSTTTSGISISTASLTNFGAVAQGSSSTEQQFSVTAIGLSADLVISAPTGFEISLTSGSGFQSSINISPTGGSVTSTTIYVRFSPGSAGAFSGNITNSSDGVSVKNVAVSGTGLSTEPTTQASGVNFTSVGKTGFTINWTSGNGSNRLVVMRAGSAVNSDPVDGTSYNANAAFGTGGTALGGGFVVYNGSGSSVEVTGLSEGIEYHLAIFEFNGTEINTNYYLTEPARGNQSTLLSISLLDSFSDGNFTENPVWSGDVNDWEIVENSDAAAGATGSKTLRLKAQAVIETSHLRTQVTSWKQEQEWGLFVGRRGQVFSSTNRLFIWLFANEANLESSTVDGYRLSIGDDSGGDDILLQYIVDGAVSSTVITSIDALTNGLTDIGFIIRVTRSSSGLWTLYTSTLPTTNGSGAIATTLPTSGNAAVNQGSATHNTLAPSSNGYFGVGALHSTNSNAVASTEIDNIFLTTSGADVITSVSSIASFGNVALGTPSSASTYTVSGDDLTSSITVEAPTHFEVSTDGASYSSSVDLNQSGGNLTGEPVTIYVRLNPALAVGSVSGNITHTATGATTKNIAVSGNTLAAEPTTSSTVSFDNVAATSLTVNFTGGNGGKRIVIAKQGGSVTYSPADAVPVSGTNSDFSLATDLGSGNKIIYNDNGNSVSVTNLLPATTYYFAVYEYNEGTGNSQNYRTAAGTGNQTTGGETVSTSSDIIATSSFEYPGNIDYRDYQSTDVELGNSVTVASFTIRDGGESADDDNFGTELTGITFTVTNHAMLRRIALFDGENELAEIASAASAAFSGITNLETEDNGSKELTIRVTFASTVTDNLQIAFTVSSAIANSEKSGFAAANAGGASSSVENDNNRIEVTATKLLFVQQPTTAFVGANISPAVTVRGTDNNDNTDLDFTGSISVTSSGSLNNTPVSSNASSGVATFGSLSHSESGTGLVLTAASSGLTSANSSTFVVEATPPGVLLLEENFAYSGLLTDNGYTALSGTGTNNQSAGASGLVYANYSSSAIGNALSVANTGQDVSRTFSLQISPATIYAAFLVNISAAQTGDYFLAFAPSSGNTTYRARLFVKASSNSGNVNFGISNALTATYGTTDFALNTTHLVVVKYQFTSATSATATVYVNPTLNFEPQTPEVTVTDNAGSNAPADITSFAIRQGTNTAAPTLVLDGIRIATNWGSLMGSPQFSGNANLGAGNYNTINVKSGADITLTGNVTVSGNLILEGGKILLGSNTLSANNISGASGSSYIVTNGAGGLRKRINVPAFESSTVTYPVGTINGYSPVSVTFNNITTAGDLTVSATQTVHPNVVTSDNSMKRYWSLTKDETLAFDSYSASFTYLAADFNTGLVEADHENIMVVGKYSSGWTFPTIGTRTPGSTDDGGTIEVTGLTSFSDFTIGLNESALPVELVSFTAKVKSSAVHLQWETATEVNNYGFEVERSNAAETMHASSIQGRTWQKIGFVEGNGNSNSPKSYSFTDRNASAGKYIYRLKQVDTDGAFDYSDEVAVDLGTPAQFSLSQNYPNPFNPSTLVQYAVPVQSVVVLEIYDITGTRVAQPVNALHEPGSYSALFNLTDLNLASGTYIYRLSATDMSGNIMYSAINKMLLLK